MKIISALFLFSSLASVPASFGALGDPATSISQDQNKLSAERKNADVFKNYSVQELVTGANTIKEFVNDNGVIFAIAWKGIDHPDLSVILGSYYQSYQKSEATTPRSYGKRARNIKRENLVVQKWGQMRSLRGRAYDPTLIPAGVSIHEIQ